MKHVARSWEPTLVDLQAWVLWHMAAGVRDFDPYAVLNSTLQGLLLVLTLETQALYLFVV